MNEEYLGLPPIYKRQEKECYLDPIRKKLIYITPEETVRQKVISYLINVLNVPKDMIIVEQHLSHYGIKTRKRADIVIHRVDLENNIMIPVAVIECKAPDVYLDERARDQMLEYCDLIGADYAMLVNGESQLCFRYDKNLNEYIILESFPNYKNLLKDKYVQYDAGELPQRIPFNDIESYLQGEFSSYQDPHESSDISPLTSMEIAVPIFNLWDGLLDIRVKMPIGDYGRFKLIEDYGVRMLSYGNASGGKFFGPYRSFLVEINGSVEFYSIGIATYWKSSSPEKVKTCICVAHDDEEKTHHALQLVVDDNLVVNGKKIDFYHHGRIAIGRKGSEKIDELRMFVQERCPEFIHDKKFYLGSLINDRLWRLDDPEVIKLVVNLISYAMVRDEYREFVKNKL